MPLRLRDTLTGGVKAVVPRAGGPLTLYVCGPTVYDVTHLGHGRTYLFFDVIRRWLLDRKVPVRHVMNITDFEDKITRRAEEMGVGWKELARREERRFLADLGCLGILPPHRLPRASEFVPAMIDVTRRLERKGRLVRHPDGWFFRDEAEQDTENFPVGGELAQHVVAEPGHPFPESNGSAKDFLVWKPQTSPAPSWPSPWGAGVPGWHLECFAMAEKYLSVPVDLHGGGADLVFPHHFAENQVALCLYGRPFSRVFFHTAFVTERGHKMSKSVGNLVPLHEALEGTGAEALRWYLLSTPYHNRLEWSRRDLGRLRREYRYIQQQIVEATAPGAGGTLPLSRIEGTVMGLLDDIGDGFRVADGLDRVRALATEIERRPNGRLARGDRPRARALLRRAELVLGLALT